MGKETFRDTLGINERIANLHQTLGDDITHTLSIIESQISLIEEACLCIDSMDLTTRQSLQDELTDLKRMKEQVLAAQKVYLRSAVIATRQLQDRGSSGTD